VAKAKVGKAQAEAAEVPEKVPKDWQMGKNAGRIEEKLGAKHEQLFVAIIWAVRNEKSVLDSVDKISRYLPQTIPQFTSPSRPLAWHVNFGMEKTTDGQT